MGANDDREMLEVAKRENLRLEGELETATRIIQGLSIVLENAREVASRPHESYVMNGVLSQTPRTALAEVWADAIHQLVRAVPTSRGLIELRAVKKWLSDIELSVRGGRAYERPTTVAEFDMATFMASVASPPREKRGKQ